MTLSGIAWRKGWRERRPPCPKCATARTTAFLNYPGCFVCENGHRYDVPELVVAALIRNPDAA